MMGRRIQFVGTLLWGCLMAVAPGCLLPRAETGIAYQRPGGSDAVYSASAENSPASSARRDAGNAEKSRPATDDKPELLPWRSRIKEHFLNGRFAHDRKASSDQPHDDPMTISLPEKPTAESSTRPKIKAKTVSASTPVSSPVDEDLSLPPNAVSHPKLNRPDFVAD